MTQVRDESKEMDGSLALWTCLTPKERTLREAVQRLQRAVKS